MIGILSEDENVGPAPEAGRTLLGRVGAVKICKKEGNPNDIFCIKKPCEDLHYNTSHYLLASRFKKLPSEPHSCAAHQQINSWQGRRPISTPKKQRTCPSNMRCSSLLPFRFFFWLHTRARVSFCRKCL